MYEYNARLIKVVDGDTIDVCLDMGLRIFREERLRLADINAPERYRPGGHEATQHLLKLLIGSDPERMKNPTIRVKTGKTGKYGRWIAWVYVGDQTKSVNDMMIEDGHAKIYGEKYPSGDSHDQSAGNKA